MREHEKQEELDLWEFVNFKPFADERVRLEEYNTFRHSIANRILTIVEEVYWTIDNPCSALVGQVLWEELAPIIKEWREYNSTNK